MSLPVLTLVAALAVSGPRLPFVAKPACPFECCQYGRWTARVSLRVRPRVRELRAVAFTIAAGDSFTALEGEVWVNRAGLVIVQRRLPIYEREGAPTMLPPGERLFLLDYLGEGGWNAWTRGRRVGTNQEDWGDSLVRVVRWPDFEWWVHVQTFDGRTGWVLVSDSRTPEDSVLPVDGADGCG